MNNTVEQRFFSLFNGLTRAYGEFKLSGSFRDGVKAEGRATTVKGQLTLSHWRDHIAGRTGLGIIPITDDGTVFWGAIDIDVYPIDFQDLENKIKALHLPLIICKSKSGGAHVYMFLKEESSAALVRAKMSSIASAIGHPKVEIYPKQIRLASNRDVGNWLNMPYFSGDKSERHALRNGKPLDMAQFLALAESSQISMKDLEELRVGSDDFSDGPPCLQHLSGVGFPSGSRNNGLFAVAVYFRNKTPDSWEKEVEEANQRYMQPPLSSREVLMVTRSASKKTYAYNCTQNPIVDFCSKEVCRHRKFGVGNINEDDALSAYNFGSLTQIKTTPPLWIFEVNGVRLELSTDELLSFSKFRMKYYEASVELLPMIKQHVWEKLLQERSRTVDYMDAPTDADPEGRLWYLLDMFCTQQGQAVTKDDILMGRPYLDEENACYYFRSTDFLRFLDQQHFRAINGTALWAALRRRGCGYKQFKIKGKVVSIWIAPSFTQQTEPFDIPETTEEF